MFLLEKYEALGTLFWIEGFDAYILSNHSLQKKIQEDMKECIQTFEQKFSRFRLESFVTTLSKTGTVSYDEDLQAMLSFGDSLEEKTGGLFSLFIGNTLIQKGYGSEEFLVSGEEGLKHSGVTPSFEVINGQIKTKRRGGIDLGGIGKGYLIDLLKKRLQEKWGAREFLINGGGDIYVTTQDGKPVQIFLEHPTEKDTFLGSIFLHNQGFAASSSFKRSWMQEGKEVNHFISSTDIWGGCFIVSESALLADAYAKVLLLSLPKILSEKDTLEALSSFECEPYMLMCEKGVFIAPSFPPIQSIV